MNATLTTDASYSKKYQVGTYAFWISCRGGPFKKSGFLRNNSADPSQAEMKCIINALAYLLKQKEVIERTKNIYINTDSLNAIHLFSGDAKAIRRWGLNKKSYNKILAKYKEVMTHFKGKVIVFQHIKAHKSTATPAQWVNNWCDENAKEQMRIRLEQIQSKNKQLNK